MPEASGILSILRHLQAPSGSFILFHLPSLLFSPSLSIFPFPHFFTGNPFLPSSTLFRLLFLIWLLFDFVRHNYPIQICSQPHNLTISDPAPASPHNDARGFLRVLSLRSSTPTDDYRPNKSLGRVAPRHPTFSVFVRRKLFSVLFPNATLGVGL